MDTMSLGELRALAKNRGIKYINTFPKAVLRNMLNAAPRPVPAPRPVRPTPAPRPIPTPRPSRIPRPIPAPRPVI